MASDQVTAALTRVIVALCGKIETDTAPLDPAVLRELRYLIELLGELHERDLDGGE